MTILLVGMEIFSVFVQKMFCDRLFEKKHESSMCEAAVWTSFFMLFNAFTYKELVSVFLNAAIFGVLFFCVLEVLYHGSFKKKLVVTAFMYLIGMGSEFLVYQGGSALGLTVGMTTAAGEGWLICAIISKLIWFTAVRTVLLVWREHQDNSIRLVDWAATMLVPMSSIFIAAAIIGVDNGERDVMKFVAACLILLLNLLTFYLFDRVQANAANQAEKEYIQKQMRRYADLNNEIRQNWFEMQSFKHDLKQRYILEQSYLQQKNYLKLSECYEESIDFLQNGKMVANTGNICIDNIINYKTRVAERKGIEIYTDLLVAYDVLLDEGDICSLLGNLLDNAIEGVETVREVDRIIKVKVRMSGQNMLVTTENSYCGKRKKRGERYLSTKEENGEHGIGLKIVEEIVKRYHGEMVIEDDGNLFYVKILLYNINRNR